MKVWGLGLMALWILSCQSTDKETVNTVVQEEMNSKSEVKTSTLDTIVIEGMQFKPAEMTINPGDTLVWINRDIVMHNVTDDPKEEWTSGDIAVGETWLMVPTSDAEYFCTIHPTMKGKIKITK